MCISCFFCGVPGTSDLCRGFKPGCQKRRCVPFKRHQTQPVSASWSLSWEWLPTIQNSFRIWPACCRLSICFCVKASLGSGERQREPHLRRPGAHSHQLQSWCITILQKTCLGLRHISIRNWCSPVPFIRRWNAAQANCLCKPHLGYSRTKTIPSWSEKVWHWCMEWSDSTSFSMAGHLLLYQTTNYWKASFTVHSSCHPWQLLEFRDRSSP